MEQNNPYYKLDCHSVINNPSQDEMYMVPILVATFDNRNPPILSEEVQDCWEWEDDAGWTIYGEGQVSIPATQKDIEIDYLKYMVDPKFYYKEMNAY